MIDHTFRFEEVRSLFDSMVAADLKTQPNKSAWSPYDFEAYLNFVVGDWFKIHSYEGLWTIYCSFPDEQSFVEFKLKWL